MSRLVFLLLGLCASLAASEYVRVCYHTNWSQYRPGAGKFWPENIDPYLCTHLVYSFAKISRGKLAMYEWNDDKLYPRFQALKKKNPELKTLLAVGGWNHENANSPFSAMVKTKEKRQAFIAHAVAYLRKWEFDGLDLDWEYPATRGGSPAGDKQKFTYLCSELRSAFQAEAKKSGNPRLLLTAAVSAGYVTIDKAYEPRKLARSLDWINVMAYDLHGNWDKVTGHHTAMEGNDKLTVPYAVKYWIKKGMPPRQIALGMGTYGRGFYLNDASVHGLGAPKHAHRNPVKGKYTREAGFVSYYEICEMKLNVVKQNNVMAPYGYKGTTWVGFDTQESLIYKIDTLIKPLNLRGAMFWALDLDDFSGKMCGQGPYPLINAVKKYLGSGVKPVLPPSKKPPVTRPRPNTRPRPTSGGGGGGKRKCKAIGAYTGNKRMNRWCRKNCARGNCPGSICKCK